MSIPAEVFGEEFPSEMLPGQLFKLRDSWALRVVFGNQTETKGFIMLEGDYAGRLIKIGSGMPRCLMIASSFTWFPAVEDGATPQRDANQTATLTVGPAGPVIIGGDVDGGGFDTDYIAFDLDGRQNASFDAHRSVVRFAKWSVELQHPSRPYESLGRLLLVDRSQSP
ncbi:hypothetical protein [Lysobacter capsici]|uniref:hypothetical protein n=1 Tax=Lysobacter capsici TaxID=435897 RepID=UPI000448F00D|nr:hypothetical protein [Lysobacter capsici]